MDSSCGAVVFTGSSVAVSGDNAWHDLSFTAENGTVTFGAGATQTVAGDIGFADHSTLQSSVAGTAWRLAVGSSAETEPYDVGRVFVSDSDASAGRVIRARAGCRDLGGNTDWIFTPVQGTIMLLR